MRRLTWFAALAFAAIPALSARALAEEIGSVSYQFKWIGPNDKIVVEAFDDPKVAGSAA
jgi:CreA protein